MPEKQNPEEMKDKSHIIPSEDTDYAKFLLHYQGHLCPSPLPLMVM